MVEKQVPPLLTVVPTPTAEELISAISPHAQRWGAFPDHWIFRGQWDSSLPLQPSACRPSSFEPFLAKDDPWRNEVLFSDRRFRWELEHRVLRDFFRQADACGLHIPDRPMVVGNLRGFELWPDHYWPMHAFIALARHHGVPTRLLDWTRKGNFAAYFAAADRKTHEHPDGTLAVWALNQEFVTRERIVNGLRLELFTPPRSENPNMHAQEGLFTFFTDDDDAVVDLEAALDWAALHERASSQREPLFPPVLYRFDLPRTEAPKLLRLLSYEQVDAARLFRGYDGVVEAMRLKSLWDWRAPTG